MQHKPILNAFLKLFKGGRTMKKMLSLLVLSLLVVFFANNAFCETQQKEETWAKDTCNQAYNELKALQEKIRTLMGNKTTFDVEKDKDLYDTLTKYINQYLSQYYSFHYDNECDVFPVIRRVKNLNNELPLQLILSSDSREFPWVYEYANKGIPVYESKLTPFGTLENVKVCLLSYESGKRLNDHSVLTINCPFAHIEKSWEMPIYQLAKDGKPVFVLSSLWGDYLPAIKLEPEIRAWFEKEFGIK